MKGLYKILAIAGITTLFTSCFDKENPNFQLFPDMYKSVAYETYDESDVFKDGQEAQLPVEGTIKRGFEIYDYPNTPEGLALAKQNLKSPIAEFSKEDEQKAKELYGIYCAICHGEKGDGKGTLVEREKFLGVPNYKDRELVEGGVFHVITNGLNAMGAHKNQLSQEERWLVTHYVLQLKSKL